MNIAVFRVLMHAQPVIQLQVQYSWSCIHKELILLIFKNTWITALR